MTIGLSLFGVSMLLINVPSGAGIFAVMFVMCGGMFFVHAAAMGTVNKLAAEYYHLLYHRTYFQTLAADGFMLARAAKWGA